MRAKALLLTAAISVAGLATASAAVYSVNAVGYINVSVAAGTFQIVANQLDNGNGNDLRDLLPTPPAGTTVYKWTGTGYDILSYDDLDAAWLPATTDISLNPGEAAFFRAPGGSDVDITFVGEVMQGSLQVTYPGGNNFSMISSIVPQEAAIDVLGFVAAAGDTIYQYDPSTGSYAINSYDDLDAAWLPNTPVIGVGEGFFLRSPNGGNWTRDFDVNQ